MNHSIFFKNNILEKYKNKELIIINHKDITKYHLIFLDFTKETSKLDASLFFKDSQNLKYTITSNIINKIIYQHKLTFYQKCFLYFHLKKYLNEKYLINNIINYLEGYELIYKK
jgi:hypothetical protein